MQVTGCDRFLIAHSVCLVIARLIVITVLVNHEVAAGRIPLRIRIAEGCRRPCFHFCNQLRIRITIIDIRIDRFRDLRIRFRNCIFDPVVQCVFCILLKIAERVCR